MFMACDDALDDVRPGCWGECSSNPVSGTSSGGAASYAVRISELADRLTALAQDYNDLMSVWNATKNFDYTRRTAAGFLPRANAIRDAQALLTPPARYEQANLAFRDAVNAIRLSLISFIAYLDSEGADADMLLQANLRIQEYNRHKDRYNALN
jgi:hypothetical protein